MKGRPSDRDNRPFRFRVSSAYLNNTTFLAPTCLPTSARLSLPSHRRRTCLPPSGAGSPLAVSVVSGAVLGEAEMGEVFVQPEKAAMRTTRQPRRTTTGPRLVVVRMIETPSPRAADRRPPCGTEDHAWGSPSFYHKQVREPTLLAPSRYPTLPREPAAGGKRLLPSPYLHIPFSLPQLIFSTGESQPMPHRPTRCMQGLLSSRHIDVSKSR